MARKLSRVISSTRMLTEKRSRQTAVPAFIKTGMAETLQDIHGNPDNPRHIRDEVKKRLENTLIKYGDLSGLVVNKDGTIISAHQRKDIFLEHGGQITITEKFKKPQSDGTIARGWVVLSNGQKYVYRRVDWDKRTAAEATIIANGTFGEWDEGVVLDVWAQEFDIEQLLEMGMPASVFGEKGELNESELVQFFARKEKEGGIQQGKIILHYPQDVLEVVLDKLEAIDKSPEKAVLTLLEIE